MTITCHVVQVVGGLPEDTPEVPDIPTVKGHQLQGGPQMLQLRCTVLTCVTLHPQRACNTINLQPGEACRVAWHLLCINSKDWHVH